MGGTGGGDEAYPLCVKLKMSPLVPRLTATLRGLGSLIPSMMDH